MTKAEAIAIGALLPNARRDIQEVTLRLTMHREGKLLLTDDEVDNSVVRLTRAVESLDTVAKMARAELD